MRALLCACALAFAPAAASAAEPSQAPAAHAGDWADRLSHGVALAKLAQPEDLVLSTALKQLDEGLVKTLQSDPDIQKIESMYPGFTKRYYAAARPELSKTLAARLPALWQAIAEAYAGEMTIHEMQEQARFLQSPLGQKMQRLSTDNFDPSELLQSTVESGLHNAGDKKAGEKEVGAAAGMAMLYFLSQLTEAERNEFVAYMGSPAGKAAQRSGPAVMAAVVKWMNADDPEAEAKMGQIAIGVLDEMKKEKGEAK